jgi:hypothetical protein
LRPDKLQNSSYNVTIGTPVYIEVAKVIMKTFPF